MAQGVGSPMVLDARLLEILRSPLLPDGPPLVQEGDWLVCREGGHRFPVVDGIPHLLPEDAQPLAGATT